MAALRSQQAAWSDLRPAGSWVAGAVGVCLYVVRKCALVKYGVPRYALAPDGDAYELSRG